MEHAEEMFNPLMPYALDLRAGRGVAAVIVHNPKAQVGVGGRRGGGSTEAVCVGREAGGGG